MKRFLPPTGGSSDTSTGKKTCGEPTCKHKSLLITAIRAGNNVGRHRDPLSEKWME
ncbi:expressed unknown protein [Ectocarpus siliculosus]|uniref:Uncharacterized protein n=1 Tax=Ectocarpus siliculosus TaxID=2880 RepID=D8LM87_ECTSI|nr:expressed unknown protein [Ectocarpus siliculosus]|eukprot:CBN77497.1 expressed unknown protein [Ectocarpus siliculosus]